MKLTTFTDYSLRVLMYLAAEPDRRATIAEISAAFGVSVNHLVKVVHALARQGWADRFSDASLPEHCPAHQPPVKQRRHF